MALKTVYKKLAAVFILGLFLLNVVTVAAYYIVGLSEAIVVAALFVLAVFAVTMFALFVRNRSTEE